jgi:ABC-type cobalamin/Fe3+-siderophores transport system ATPase subunit
VLTLTDLRKRFGAIQALDGCSFSVERGRMLGFLGPNGAGKTTAMRAIFGLVEPDSGAVSWDGRPVGAEERLRRASPRAPPPAEGRPLTGKTRAVGGLAPKPAGRAEALPARPVSVSGAAAAV